MFGYDLKLKSISTMFVI